MSEKPKLFIGCENIFMAFDETAEKFLGMSPTDYEAQFGAEQMWGRLRGTPGFYTQMPITPDGQRFWDEVKGAQPIIFASFPGIWAIAQKTAWFAERLNARDLTMASPGAKIPSHPGDILVDQPRERAGWESNGGLFVPYLNLPDTLRQLRDLSAI